MSAIDGAAPPAFLTSQPAAAPQPPPRAGRPRLRYFLSVAALMGTAYAALYFPYGPGTLPARALMWYLRQVARVCAAVVRVYDPLATTGGELGELGTLIVGRFSLRIVLDCAALDAHALLAAAVLAFPVAWPRRIAGVVVGTLAVAAINVLRIVILYVAGVRWPDAFHVLHEEVLQLLIILTTFLVFAGWIVWARRARPA